MVAVGWTGKWYADVQQTEGKSVSLKAGMERMKLPFTREKKSVPQKFSPFLER
jgi:hypothetical protein